jgi:hypothetical protein
MEKKSFANRFGLIVLMMLSLFAATAFAGNAPGATPVVVTNAAANPVPVAVQKTQFFQATQTLYCTGATQVTYTFDVPSGKVLIVRSVNVEAGSHGTGETFGVEMKADDGSTSHLAFGMQPLGGGVGFWASNWALNQPIQMVATQAADVFVYRNASDYAYGCSATVTISGELL